ncbi:hypothetical protein [Methylomonas albis]|uniref:Curli production assembly/transport component CsgF n=1 Tax=Methylomonas albis TaxID=1854563 RepID=A0ABR9D0X8_9GAMM|nr:hypothetical protein [Methylomonas albis]MBD9355883.1 hypothetical protein [Methylomonas albis]
MNSQYLIKPKTERFFVSTLKFSLLAVSICTLTPAGTALAFGTIDPAGVTNTNQVRYQLIDVAQDNYVQEANRIMNQIQQTPQPYSDYDRAELSKLIDAAEANINAADTLARLAADLSMDVQDYTTLSQALDSMEQIETLKNTLSAEAFGTGVRQLAETENISVATATESNDLSSLEVTMTEDSGDTYAATVSVDYGSGGYGGGGDNGGGDNGGGVWGDPHYIDLTNPSKNPLERDFDVMGQAGKVFNILSDKQIQVNNLYKSSNVSGATMVGAVGIKLLDDFGEIHQIQYSTNSAPMLDGKMVKESEIKTVTMQGKKATVAYDAHVLKIETPEYKLKFTAQTDDSLDERIQIQPSGVLTDNVPPHGLLGQTADGDSNIRHGKTGDGAQGEGAIDYSYQKYQVVDLFSDPDADINRFQILTTLSFDKEGITRIGHAATGKLLATKGTDGYLVSVRYQVNEDGTERVTLADGKTVVNQQGNILVAESSKTILAQIEDRILLAMR